MYLIIVQKRVYLWPLGMEYSYGIILINLKTLCNALTSICDGWIKKIKKKQENWPHEEAVPIRS